MAASATLTGIQTAAGTPPGGRLRRLHQRQGPLARLDLHSQQLQSNTPNLISPWYRPIQASQYSAIARTSAVNVAHGLMPHLLPAHGVAHAIAGDQRIPHRDKL